MASLTMNVSLSSSAVNLTTVGLVDWVDWNNSSTATDWKSGGGHTIPDPTLYVGGGFGTYTNDARTISWTDGTNTGTSSNTAGCYNNGVVGTGLQLVFTADTTVRTVYIYPAVYNMTSAAHVTATLSDASAGPASDTTTLVSAASTLADGVIQLIYSAASGGQTLTVVWTSQTSGGTTNLQAAAIASAGGAGNSASIAWVK